LVSWLLNSIDARPGRALIGDQVMNNRQVSSTGQAGPSSLNTMTVLSSVSMVEFAGPMAAK
jgi:hypothetical protein